MTNLKIYIRHCGERTVSILEEYFKSLAVTLIDGVNKPFTEVYLENLKLIHQQEEDYAIVADGDLIPLVPLDHLIDQMISPLKNDPNLIIVNATRIDKFFIYPTIPIPTGGFKAYSKKEIILYIDNFDNTQLKPETYLNTLFKRNKQLEIDYPLCGHEYGQYLWHLYEKGYQRGAKSKDLPDLRPSLTDLEIEVYREGIQEGIKNKEGYKPKEYKEDTLPEKFRDKERIEISNLLTEFESMFTVAIQHASDDKLNIYTKNFKDIIA